MILGWVSVGVAVVGAQEPNQDLARQDELRRLAGYELSEAALIEDYQPFTWADEVLVRLIYRASKIPPELMTKWALPLDSASWETLRKDPTANRFHIFRVLGRLENVTPAPPRAGQWTDLPPAYECRLTSGGTSLRAVVSEVPAALLDGQPLDHQVGVVGLFARMQLDDGADAEESAVPLFVGARLAWYPDRADDPRQIGDGQLALAAMGMDIGLLDQVRKQNRQPLTNADRPAFDAMLQVAAVAARDDPRNLPSQARVDFMSIMSNATAHVGDWVELEGNVKRVTPWEHRSEDGVVTRFLQVDLFVPLGNSVVRLRGGDGQEYVFRGRFPVTAHVLESRDEDNSWVGRRVVVRGFFYRLWAYESVLTDEQRLLGGQLSPLILATSVSPVEVDEEAVGRWLTWIMVALLTVVIGLVGAYYWFDRRVTRSRPMPDRIALP